MAARHADPTKRREDALRRDLARLQKSIERLITAYQEYLVSLDELRHRMRDLRQRGSAMRAEFQSIADQTTDRTAYLRLAETLTAFLVRLRSSAETLDITERQRVVRPLVKEILVSDDRIVIRLLHSPSNQTLQRSQPIAKRRLPPKTPFCVQAAMPAPSAVPRIFWILLPLFAALLAPRSACETSVSRDISITITSAIQSVSLTPASVTFPSQNIGTTSAAETMTITNTGSALFPLSSVAIASTNAGDFAETNNCPSPLAVRATCQTSATFTPTAAGTRTASVVASVTGGASYATSLGGTGVTGPALSTDFFGLHVGSASDWPVDPTILATRGKCAGTGWAYSEPSKEVYDWSNLDYCVSVARSHNATPVLYSSDCTNGSICTGGLPSWEYPNCNAADYGTFIGALATRYGTSLLYELWNEPETAWTRHGGACTPAQLSAMMNAAYNAIRANAPAATIIAPSSGTGLLASMYAAGLTQNVDIGSAHWYTDNIEGCSSPPEYVIACYNSYLSNVSQYATIASKPLWMTEGSAYTGYSGGAGLPPDATKAAYIGRYYLLLAALGIQRVYWFQWDDTEFGQIYPITVAVTAYNQIQNWLIGSSNFSYSVNGNVHTVKMTQSGGNQAQAAWNTAGSSTYSVPAGYTHYKDLAGRTNPIAGGTVAIGSSPILLTP